MRLRCDHGLVFGPGRSRPSGQLDRAGSKFEGRGDAIGDGPERVENGPREGRPRSLGQRSFFRHPRLAQAVVIPVKNFEIARKGPGQAPPAIWELAGGRNNLSLMWLVNLSQGAARSASINAAIAALRFFFTVTLERPDLVRPLRVVNEPRKAPVVLSREEVARLLEAAPGHQVQGCARRRLRRGPAAYPRSRT